MTSNAERLALPSEVGQGRTPWWAWGVLALGLALTFGVAYVLWLRGPLHPVPGLTALQQITHLTSPEASHAAILLLWVVGGGVVLSRVTFAILSTFGAPLRRKDTVAGIVDTAHMATVPEMDAAGLINAKCGDVIGYVVDPDTGEEIVLRWPGELGKEGIGRQESGKTASAVKPGLLARNEHEDAKNWSEDERRAHPFGWETLKIVLAVKPDLVASTAGFHESIGENVIVLNPFATNPNAPHYNPLHLIRVGTRYMFGDCFRFALSMIDQGAGLTTYWDRTAHEALASIIAHAAFTSLRENDPKMLSLPWIAEFIDSLGDVDKLCTYIINYEHDPHSIFNWTERKYGKSTGKSTKTCPWIANAMRALAGKAPPEKSGIFGSFKQFLVLYGDEVLRENVCDSTFDIKDLANDRTRSSIVYLRMPAADIDRCRPYVRLLFNTFFHELMRKTVTRGGREMRGILRGVDFIFDEAAQLNRMEDVERYAGLMRGLGGRLHQYWQNRNQQIKVNGRENTISGNLGVHFYFRPETLDEAKPLSEELGKFSYMLQHRNLSGDRMALMKDHLAEQNQVQTREHFTPAECKSLAADEVFIFCRGLHIRAKQFLYFKNEAMDRRSKIPWSGRSAVTVKVPFCIAHLERELGAEKLAQLLKPAPDRYKEHREAAQVLENGCRVASWAETDEDTGVRTYFLQFWLPEPARFPIIDAPFPAYKDRAKALKDAIKMFDDRDKPPAPPASGKLPQGKAKKSKRKVDPAEVESVVTQQFAQSDRI